MINVAESDPCHPATVWKAHQRLAGAKSMQHQYERLTKDLQGAQHQYKTAILRPILQAKS